MKLNIENSKLDYVGEIIDFLVIKLNNGTVINVGGIDHIGTIYISEDTYNIMLIKDINTKIEHKILLDDSNYYNLVKDILK